MASSAQTWAETAVGAVVLAVAGAFLTYALGHAVAQGLGGGYDLTARFGQVGSLAAGSDVRVAGVKVGQVSAVELDPKTFLARVRFRMDAGVKLPSDSTVKITSDGLLGGQHVAVEPGGATEELKPGGEFQNVQGAVDLFGLIGQVLRPPSGAQGAAAPAPAANPAATAPPAGAYGPQP